MIDLWQHTINYMLLNILITSANHVGILNVNIFYKTLPETLDTKILVLWDVYLISQ